MSEAITFTEISDLLARLSPLETDNAVGFKDWLYAFTRSDKPAFRKLRLELFASHHGTAIADHGREAACSTAEAYIQQCLGNQAPITRICQDIAADLRVYEMDLSTPTRDRRIQAAMDEQEMVRAVSYGMMAVAPDADIYAMGAFGAGSDDCAHALLATDEAPLVCLQNSAGFDICALAGAILATRLAGLPLLLEAPQGLSALHVLSRYVPHIGQHCCIVYTPDNRGTLPEPPGRAQSCFITDELPDQPGLACAFALSRVMALAPVIDAEYASNIDEQEHKAQERNDMRHGA